MEIVDREHDALIRALARFLVAPQLPRSLQGLAPALAMGCTVVMKPSELAPGLQKAAQDGSTPEQLKQLEGQFTAVATTHGFTRAFLWSTFLMLGAAVVTIVGLSIKHKDLATDGQSGPVHMG